MAESYRVFINADQIFTFEYEDVKRAFLELGKEGFLQELYGSATENLASYLGDEIGYFQNIEETYSQKEYYVLGVESPDEIKKAADSWNKDILLALKTELDSFESAKLELGVETIYEVFEKWNRGYPQSP